MGFARDEGKAVEPKLARVYHGPCYICGEPIMAFQAYIGGVGGSLTRRVGKAHWGCYRKPLIADRT